MRDGGGDADEETMYALLVASERVARWLECIKQQKPGWRTAARELRKAVEVDHVYAEEAQKGDAVGVATSMLRRAGAEADAVLDDVARIIAVRNLHYGGVSVRIQEGSLGDGLGNKVWASAHGLAELLAKSSELVRGRHVLELGSGCGLAGILAAKLGAAQVTLTDCVPSVLRTLAASVALNAELPTDPDRSSGADLAKESADVELWDPEDADDCDDEDELFSSAAMSDSDPAGQDGSMQKSIAGSAATWDQGCMRIRHFEWLDSVRHLNGEVSRYGVDDGEGVLASRLDAEQHILMPARPVGADSTAAVTQADSAAQDALQLPTDEQFEVIIGSDLLYEHEQARLLTAALAHRLERRGRAFLVCPVRDEAIFEEFGRHLAERRLHCFSEQVEIPSASPGIIGTRLDYEGSFRHLQVSWANWDL